MLKLSLLALAVFASCQVEGGKLPTNRRFQRQEVLDSAPYPPSGFRPDGNGFELPTENELPEVSAEQIDNDNGLEEFSRLKSPIKTGKLVQGQLQTNVASLPLNYVQQTSPIFAKIQAVPVQPQFAFNTPVNYAPYQQQALLQPQVQTQQKVEQTNFSDKLQQPSSQIQQSIGPLQSTSVLSSQPTVFNSQLQQPAGFGAQIPQPAAFGSQLQQPAGFSSQLQQPSVFGAQLQQPATYNPQLQQPADFSTQPQQPAAYNPQLQQPSVFGAQLQQPSVFGAQLQQPAVFGAQLQQPSVYGAQLQQPTLFNGELQQPAFFNGQLAQSSVYGAQLQQPTLFNGQLLQNYW